MTLYKSMLSPGVLSTIVKPYQTIKLMTSKNFKFSTHFYIKNLHYVLGSAKNTETDVTPKTSRVLVATLHSIC